MMHRLPGLVAASEQRSRDRAVATPQVENATPAKVCKQVRDQPGSDRKHGVTREIRATTLEVVVDFRGVESHDERNA
jgi:hypothetical protein